MGRLTRLRFILMVLAVALGATALLLAVSGGFRVTVGGFRISARSPLAAAIAALLAAGTWLVLARRRQSIAADLEAAWRTLDRHATRIVGAIALSAAITAAMFATRSAAGADASGYLSQAAMWAAAEARYADPLAPLLASDDPWITTPLGWRPATDPGFQSPTYPPGLSLLMAIPHALAGLDGANAIVIAAAAIAVWATGMIAGGISGVIAALLLAFSPVFLYQSFQPMSDVPVTAAWMVCFLLISRGDKPCGDKPCGDKPCGDKPCGDKPCGDKPLGLSIWAGTACALAVLIRPNLAPLALVPLLLANHRIGFAAPVAIAGLFLAVLQLFWYGSPFRSGYGPADELFSPSNAAANAKNYLAWLAATSPVLLLAPVGVLSLLRRTQNPRPKAQDPRPKTQDPRPRTQALGLASYAALVIVSYLFYAVFDQWSYLRFLLPAMAVFAIFAAVELAAWIERWPVAVRAPLLVALMLGVMAHGLFVARSLDTFKLAAQLRRVSQVGDFVNRTAPESAVILSGEQSGAMRYYTRRPILRWEAATPGALASAIDTLERAGRPVYIALDAWENEPFRARFAGIEPVGLDWPAVLEAGTSHRTRLWRVSDRALFVNGQNLTTIRLP